MENSVKISNDTIDTGFERYAYYSGLDYDNDDEYGHHVKLRVRIERWNMVDDVLTKHPLGTKWVSLVADRSTWLDAEGNFVEAGSEDAVITEFDYYVSLITQPIVHWDIFEQKVLWADAAGRFN
jgi:hypothetical protein